MADKPDPRVIRTRVAFQTALLEMLKIRQFEDIRISDLAKKANFSRYAFYSNFDSKEALLFSYIDDLFEQIVQAVYEHFETVEDIDFDQLIKLVFELWRTNSEMLRYVVQVAKKDIVIARFREHAAGFVEFYRTNANIEAKHHEREDYILDYIAGGWFMLFKRWTEEDMTTDSDTMAKLLSAITPIDLLIRQ